MSKTTTPLLSFEAHGTLGDTITYRKSRSQTSAQARYVPNYPTTLTQQYRRWLYTDGLFCWHSLTPAQKEAYRAASNANNRPLLAEFMASYLRTPADLVCWITCDQITAGALTDKSAHGNSAATTGIVAATGAISEAIKSGPGNGHGTIAHSPSLLVPDQFSISFLCHNVNHYGVLAYKAVWGSNQSRFTVGFDDPDLFFATGGDTPGTGMGWAIIDKLIDSSTSWRRVTLTQSPTQVKLFSDKRLVWTAAVASTYTSTQPIEMFSRIPGSYQLGAEIDDIRIYNRAISVAQVEWLADLRWPTS